MHEQLAQARVGGTVGQQEARAGRVKEGVLGLGAALSQNVARGVEQRHAELPSGRHLPPTAVRMRAIQGLHVT